MAAINLRGPDIAIVGWIPFYQSLANLPRGHQYHESLAMHMLFNSGNPEPPTEFDSYDAFASWLRGGREYRGALYIREVGLRYEEGKITPISSYEANGIIGYTPIRLVVAGIELTPPQRLRYRKGISPSDYEPPVDAPLPEGRGFSIIFRYQFKISPLMDLIQRSITGRWAPNAWASIEYEIYQTGLVRVLIRGTAIPSQHVYVNWRRVDAFKHDMITNAEGEINGFLLETVGCENAPPWVRQQFQEMAVKRDIITAQ
jgi:hypothetical protein